MKDSGIIWRPRPDDLENSHVARLMKKNDVDTAVDLRRLAAKDPEWFYPALLEDLGVEWFSPYARLMDRSRGLPWTEWFLGGKLNVVHNVLDRHARGVRSGQTAVIAEDDTGIATTLTYGQLEVRVCRFAAALAGLGVRLDDAVAFYLPMTADVVVALLACLKIGAVPVPVFAGFGPDALAARIRDSGARVLLTADASVRRGRAIPLKGPADKACELAGTIDHVIVLRCESSPTPWKEGRDLWWHEVEASSPPTWPTVALDASARALILYTSGTTGNPKGAVHTHAGVQVVTAKEVGYHLDVRPGDTMFWLTDIGWMMGPWEILGVLFHGGTVVLLNGLPDHPSPDRIWSMVERHRITHLALAPTAVRLLSTHGREAAARFDLTTIRVLGSTGEPWDDTAYRWFFDVAGGGRCPIMNISGGTELMGCLLAPLPVEPMKVSTLQGPALGMDVDVLDEAGRPLRGDVGYLVCRNAAPNMTRGFLNAPDRYLDTYFSRFGEEVWSHGDWASVDGDGFWFLHGRADDTLKIAGKRVGPAEVETAAASHPAVLESAAVGLPDLIKGTRLVLVSVPRPGFEPSRELSTQVSEYLAEHLGPAMRPSVVLWVSALPVTRSGKILRGLISKVLSGEEAFPATSVANPEALEGLARAAAAESKPKK